MKTKTEASLIHSIDFIIEQILELASINSPPIDALSLADLLGVSVLIDATLKGRGRQKQISGQPTILIKPDDRPERIQWAVAHEIGEIIAHRIYENEPEIFDFSMSLRREQISNLVAGRLLVPEKWFSHDCLEVDYDLFELKKRYTTASHELIAGRFPDQNHSIVITVFDQGEFTRRNSHFSMNPLSLNEYELEIWRETHVGCLPIRKKKPEMELACWPVHEPGWKREILCTTFSESFIKPDFPDEEIDQDYEVNYQC